MRKTTLASLGFVIALSVSTSLTPVQAMPAPAPTSTELNAGLSQWGAESVSDEPISREAIHEALEELARPYPKTASKASLCETLAEAAQKHNLPVGFLVRLINQESGFNPEAVSSAGAQGVAQFMPRVAQEWGLRNPFEPHSALVASARFLRSLFDQFGNWGLAAAAYNGGMGRVQKWVDKRGKLPDETRHYVKTITGVPAEQWVSGKAQANFSIPPRAPCQEIAHLADPPPAKDINDAPAPQPQVTEVAVVTTTKGKRSQTVITAKTKETQTGATSKTQVAIVTTKGKNGGKVVVSKVEPVKGKIAAPSSIVVAEKSSKKDKAGKAVVKIASGKDKTVRTAVVPAEKAKAKGKEKGFTKFADKADKAEKAPAKNTKAKAEKPEKADSKKPARGRVQVAEASARK